MFVKQMKLLRQWEHSRITMLYARIYQRTIYRRSFSEGMAVFELDPRSKATKEIDDLGKLLY